MDKSYKHILWVGSSKKDLMAMLDEIRSAFGFALYLAQQGKKHQNAKPLKGFTGAGVLEVVEDCLGDTFRAVYTVKIAENIYVLHCFQKKSKRGIETPKQEIDLIRDRLKMAQEHAKE
jgi:phage-related protein